MRLRRPGALVLILVVALSVRIVVVVATPGFGPVFDALDYDRHAESIASGHGYPAPYGAPPTEPSAFRPPLYPVVLVPTHVLGLGWTAERLLGALLGVVTVLLVVLVARRLWGRRVAVASGWIAALFPPLVLLNASLLSEQLFLPLILGALLAVLRYRESLQLRWAVLAGVLCGLCALTRASGILLFVGAMLGAWCLRPRFSRRALAPPAVIAVAMILAVTPWAVRNTIVFHRFVGLTTQGGSALAGTYNPESRARGRPGAPYQPQQLAYFRDIYSHGYNEAERAAKLTSRALAYAWRHPGYVAETLVWNTGRVFELVHDQPFHPSYQFGVLMATGVGGLVSPVIPATLFAVMLLGVIGIGAQLRSRRLRRAPAFVWAFPVLAVIPAITVWGLSRYRSPVDPFLTMLAGVGVVALLDTPAARRLAAKARRLLSRG